MSMHILWFQTTVLILFFFSTHGDIFFNNSGTEIKIFWENYVINMAVGAMVACVARPSVAMALAM